MGSGRLREVVAALLLVGCAGPPGPEPLAAVEVPLLLDFGTVVSPGRHARTLPVENKGTRTARLVSVNKMGGDAQLTAEVVDAPHELLPGGRGAIIVALVADATLRTSYRADFVVQLDDADARPFTATATGVFVECDAVRTIDFGQTLIGDRSTRTVPLINTSADTANVTVTLPPGGPFTLLDGGTGALRPGEARELHLSFEPRSVGGVGALAHFRAADLCPESDLTLIGEGVSHRLGCEGQGPAFNWCPPNHSCPAVVSITNFGFTSMPLTAFSVTGSPELVLGPDAGLEVPAAVRLGFGPRAPATLTVPLVFSPTAFGARPAEVRIRAAHPLEPELICSTNTWGGGPLPEVLPTVLDFGALTGPATSRVTLRNAGTVDLSVGLGTPLTVSGYRITALTSHAGSLSVNASFSADGGGSWGQISPQQPLEIPVTVTPGAPDSGTLLEWQLDFVTNDRTGSSAGLRIRAVQ